MSTTATTTKQKVETPFTSAALGTDVGFWRAYVAGRPTPTEDFFRLINEYHKSHGNPQFRVAHDVGTGPGNIAERLAPYYEHVVGSDVNESALAAAPSLVPFQYLNRMTFVKSPAEGLASGVVPSEVGVGKTDLITVSECIPLLDTQKALEAFHALLKPGGTLAIYFYGRPVFTDGDAKMCDEIYDKIATRICQFNLPMKDTPGFPFHLRGVEALESWLDNIPIPAEQWTGVQRHKWNYHHPLLFNSHDGFDFEFSRVDRRGEGEKTIEMIDNSFWAEEWDVGQARTYLESVYPNIRMKAGEKWTEVEEMLKELNQAMGGERRKVTFTVSLILATKM
ncbi:S-adenosyl-L-methionine-dependent methyltransferase [Delitschia confertaspora ATCC 74209]|uniref:S-adenosyl-L-methionine-dependent methyltransferase n=1 Tax=Delitschia confertaspora ATCC 74209 TaxID=1513339 RepID=A0A9P4JNR5_9PLEO|nr:S-adenosyl-L-methionine-dependent methyltransferase [Delitschia confertaspora ATCC 74209]